MDIVFAGAKLEKQLCSETEQIKAFGAKNAKRIRLRMAILRAAPCLEQVPSAPPDRLHPLKGKFKGCFAVDLQHPYRLIFRPAHNPLPVLDDGGLDRTKVTAIEIIGVEDYH